MIFKNEDRVSIMEQIFHDIKFLGTHNLMDYSLLVIIEENPKFIERQLERQTLLLNRSRATGSMGASDLLQNNINQTITTVGTFGSGSVTAAQFTQPTSNNPLMETSTPQTELVFDDNTSF